MGDVDVIRDRRQPVKRARPLVRLEVPSSECKLLQRMTRGLIGSHSSTSSPSLAATKARMAAISGPLAGSPP